MYPCACSPRGPEKTANECRHRCTTCGHEAAMHDLCRYYCCEARCPCREVTGLPDVPYLTHGGAIKEDKERNLEIWARRMAGETFTAIAKDYGFGRERARQIFLNVQRKKERAPKEEQKERDSDIWQLHNEGVTYSRIARDYKLTPERVRQIFMKEERKRAPPAPKGEQEGTGDAAVACDSPPSGHTGEHNAKQG